MRCLAPFASPERARVAKSTTHVQYEPSNNDLNGRTIASSQRDKDRDHHCTMEVASHKPSAHHCRRWGRTSRKTSPTRLCSPITSARTFSIKGKFSDVVSTPQPSHTRQSPLLPHTPGGDIPPPSDIPGGMGSAPASTRSMTRTIAEKATANELPQTSRAESRSNSDCRAYEAYPQNSEQR